MNGEIETLLKLYKEKKISKERFIAYAPAGIPKETFSDLIDDYDAGIVSDEDFISISHGMAALPPGVVAPRIIDLLEQWDRFEKTKKKFITPARLDTYRFRIRPFLVWLSERGISAWDVTQSLLMEYIDERETEREAEYKPSTIQAIRREIKIFFQWLDDEIKEYGTPLKRMKIKKIKGSPDTFHIRVEYGKLVFSEMNPIYEALYTHPDRFRDWWRIELGIRLMRETGLRTEHARRLQFRDINTDIETYKGIRCGGLVSYSRIRVPFERPPKYMPKISTLISPLFGKRIETYLRRHPEVKEDDDLFGIGSRDFQKALHKLRVWAGVSYRVYPKKFRKGFATLLVNIEPKPALWKQLTGDSVDTLSDYYADETLGMEYEGMGLKGYADIINIIFDDEGRREEEEARHVGRPRKRQAFILPGY